MLYLIATPIGNLADITFRAVEIMKSCDYLLCEDTRHSLTLLNHYDIKKPLKSYHKFNESACEAQIIQDLQEGKTIALLSDAGTPGIADPGSRLVAACRERDIPVSGAPGPCAAVLAISLSSFDTEKFQFLGFLPKKTEAIKKALQEALMYRGTSLFYESPNRLLDTLQLIQELSPERIVGVARELTKHYEEILKGTASELLLHWSSKPVKGEVVLLISGNCEPQVNWETLSPQEHVAMMESTFGLSTKEAIKAVAELRGVPKRTIYNQLH